MNEEERWQQNNDAYLAAALNWLRLRLDRQLSLLESGKQPAGEIGEPTTSGIWWWQRKGSSGDKTSSSRPLVSEIEEAATAMHAAEAGKPPPALIILAQRFELSRFEQEVLLLCVAMELDTRIASLCAQAQGDSLKRYPTFALAMALFDEPAWDILSPERPLRYWQLIEINQPGAQPLTTSPLRIEERILNYIRGLNYLDDRLTPLFVPFDIQLNEEKLPPSQQTAATAAVQQLQWAKNGPPPVIQLIGPDAVSKQLIARQTAVSVNLNLYRLPVELLPTQPTELETMVRLWQRENFLLPVALFLDAHEYSNPTPQAEGNAPPVTPSLNRFLARSQGIFIVSSREVQSGLGPRAVVIEVDKPTPAEQRDTWIDALNDTETNSPSLLASQFNMNATTIRQIAVSLKAEQPDTSSQNGHIPHAALWEACLAKTRPQMSLLAERLIPKATWDDIVLSSDAESLLRQVANQVGQRGIVYDEWGFRQKLSRGLGINALFVGDSGTGKTMAAEVIANSLNLNLYRIDLSAVVSKYIGETEKNLRRLFDAAEDGGAILFFDEADALFGKRSEVKDSHDRYANIEINYLLQRMEAYRGLAILATNMKTALDQAFMRRLRFIVNFPFPGPKERSLIWQRIFPPETPLENLDFERLGRFNVTGGSINNIALNAAFMAARQGTSITMPLVMDAARTEFRKLERPIRESDFVWQEPVE